MAFIPLDDIDGVDFDSLENPFGIIFNGTLPPVGTMLRWDELTWIILKYRSYTSFNPDDVIPVEYVMVDVLESFRQSDFHVTTECLVPSRLLIAKRILPE